MARKDNDLVPLDSTRPPVPIGAKEVLQQNAILTRGTAYLVCIIAAALGCSPSTAVSTYPEVRLRLDSLQAVASRGDEVRTEKLAVDLLTQLARQRDTSTGERKEVYEQLASQMNAFTNAAYKEDAEGLEARIEAMRSIIPSE